MILSDEGSRRELRNCELGGRVTSNEDNSCTLLPYTWTFVFDIMHGIRPSLISAMERGSTDASQLNSQIWVIRREQLPHLEQLRRFLLRLSVSFSDKLASAYCGSCERGHLFAKICIMEGASCSCSSQHFGRRVTSGRLVLLPASSCVTLRTRLQAVQNAGAMRRSDSRPRRCRGHHLRATAPADVEAESASISGKPIVPTAEN